MYRNGVVEIGPGQLLRRGVVLMGSVYSRREFLVRTAALGAGLAAFQIAPGAPAFGMAPLHPLTNTHTPDVLFRWHSAVYNAVKFERYSPTNAARTYGYLGVAAYEAVVAGMPRHRSLGRQLNDLHQLPMADTSLHYDWPTAANAAMAVVAGALFQGRDASLIELAALESEFQAERTATVLDQLAIDRSITHGRAIGNALAVWMGRDGWAEIQGLAYTPPVGPGLWERTPPNFGPSIEPYWERVRTFSLSPVTACAPTAPAAFSTDSASAFYAEAMTTHDAVINLSDAQKDISMFWRDNPDGTTGLPSGHWASIATGLVQQLGFDLARGAEVMALHGVAVADAFSSCWTEKYRTNLLRPVTYIKAHIDPNWNSFVNSPAFPEYTSGHSVGSGAAATVLTALVGTVPFTDNTGAPNGFPSRRYPSVWEAANEAALSRLHGGIHYPMGVHNGIDQGVCVAEQVMGRLRTRRGRVASS